MNRNDKQRQEWIKKTIGRCQKAVSLMLGASYVTKRIVHILNMYLKTFVNMMAEETIKVCKIKLGIPARLT